MPRTRRYRKGGGSRRKSRGGRGVSRRRRGGNVIGGVVSALKTALPSIVLYEALRMQGRRINRRRGRGTRRHRGGKRRRR